MEEEFIVKTMSDGGVVPTADIKQIMNTMGCLGFNTQATGSVKVVVEKNEGRITKQRLVWGDDNDPKFNESQQRNADALLAAAIKAVEASGTEPSEAILKFVVKK